MKQDKLPSFIKFLWDDAKVFFCFFAFVFVLFQVIGPMVTEDTFMSMLADVWSLYAILAAAGLTIIVHNWVRYKHFKKDEDEQDLHNLR